MSDPWADYPGAGPTDYRALRKAAHEADLLRERRARVASEPESGVLLKFEQAESLEKAVDEPVEASVVINIKHPKWRK